MSKNEKLTQYQFERKMDVLFDEAFFNFQKKFEEDPELGEKLLRYLKDVLILNEKEYLALDLLTAKWDSKR